MELDAERQAQGLTYEQLGERIGVEKMTAHRYLRGRKGNPVDLPFSVIIRLTEALDISLMELLDRVEKRADKIRRADSE